MRKRSTFNFGDVTIWISGDVYHGSTSPSGPDPSGVDDLQVESVDPSLELTLADVLEVAGEYWGMSAVDAEVELMYNLLTEGE